MVSLGGEVGAGYVINVKEGWIARYTHIGPSVGLGTSPAMLEESRGSVYGNAVTPKNYTNDFWQYNIGALIKGSANATAEFNNKDEIVQLSDDFNLTGAGVGASYGFYRLNDVEYYHDSINNGE